MSLAVGLLLPAMWALDRPFETGKILGIEQKTRSHVLYYLVNTPITQDDPYYEVTVQIQNTAYVCQYTPAHAKQTLPADWVVNGTIEARVEKHHLFLRQSGEAELQLVIVKQMAAPADRGGTPATVKH